MAIVAVAAGLIGMHHLACAHAEHPTAIVSAAHITPDRSGSAALVALPDDCRDHMDMVGHLCLAVLTAITSLAAALISAATRVQSTESGHVLAAVSARAAWAPPIDDARFTRLCVLRN